MVLSVPVLLNADPQTWMSSEDALARWARDMDETAEVLRNWRLTTLNIDKTKSTQQVDVEKHLKDTLPLGTGGALKAGVRAAESAESERRWWASLTECSTAAAANAGTACGATITGCKQGWAEELADLTRRTMITTDKLAASALTMQQAEEQNTRAANALRGLLR